MSTHKHIDRICCAALALALLLTLLLANGEALGLQAASKAMGYENRLFDTSKVHTIDIVMDDWDSFIANCTSKEYSACSVVIDGEAYKNVGIRGKGNYSMRIASYGSNRYSFKVEFDHYDSAKSYYGLDKLALNNISMDNTYMKDYLAYQLMGRFGVASPLCSYVYITVNGQDWGLYLAVEGIEDAFLRRNYGADGGKLYKPDNGEDFGGMGGFQSDDGNEEEDWPEPISLSELIEKLPEGSQLAAAIKEMPEGTTFWTMWEELPDDLDFSTVMEELSSVDELSEMFSRDRGGEDQDDNWGGGMEDDGSEDDVKLKYIDDDPDSYPNIFNTAKTKIDKADKKRLVAALKVLNSGSDPEKAVDVEQVIRYFVVHTFVYNSDSYTGSMVHNYYLHEKDGVLSMIPWDYNLAFGDCFNYEATASSVVNAPIDSPVSGGGIEDRPMLAWIFNSETYLALYHQYYQEFLDTYSTGGKLVGMIDSASTLISAYVEKDPTKSCTYAEYETGVSMLKEFCRLRCESVAGQLNGTIPSTSQGQQDDASALVDASAVDLSAMGDTIGGGWGDWSEEPEESDESKGQAGPAPSAPAESSEPNAEKANAPQDLSGASDTARPDGKLDAPDPQNTPTADNGGPRRGGMGGGRGSSETSAAAQDSGTVWALIAVSAVVLLAGLLAAYRCRH